MKKITVCKHEKIYKTFFRFYNLDNHLKRKEKNKNGLSLFRVGGATMKLKANNIPELLQIELTYQCNLNCVFCYNPLRNMNVNKDKLDKIVDKVCEAKIPLVYLIGGEPSILGVNTLNMYIDKLSKTSSVAMVTNGFIKLEGISTNLAVMAVSLHGYDAQSHERFNGVEGSYEKALDSIKYYKSIGLNVRCVVVLSGYNYDVMDKILLNCIHAGADEIFIDRYEDGGIGATNSKEYALKPTNEQFREALTQIIKIRNMNLIPKSHFGFGTAIPFCLDERLFSEGLYSGCGAGTDFCAVTPEGDVRICNQSNKVYGNILENEMDEIWKDSNIKDYRSLQWVGEPCTSCKLLEICQCGCRVDANQDCPYSIDYALRDDLDGTIRNNIRKINEGQLKIINDYEDFENEDLDKEQLLRADKFLNTNEYKEQYYLVMQFQGVRVGKYESEMIQFLKKKQTFTIENLFKKFDELDQESVVKFIKLLIFEKAIHKVSR